MRELQEEAARLTGMEAALLVPTGTMGNLSAGPGALRRAGERGGPAWLHACTAGWAHSGQLAGGRALCSRGTTDGSSRCPQPRAAQVILGDESHIFVYEAGGLSVLGGIPFHTVPNADNGELPLDLVEAAVRCPCLSVPGLSHTPALCRWWETALSRTACRPDDQHAAVTRCVCVEQTHNRCGGSVLSLDYLDALSALCRRKGLALHMDGVPAALLCHWQVWLAACDLRRCRPKLQLQRCC